MNEMKPKPIFDAGKYASFRPTYPPTLFEHIYKYVTDYELAWDCGCGTGQASVVLAEKFTVVTATDISAQLIENAPKRKNIRYVIEPAENTSFSNNSINLITVAQAMHWFEPKQFEREVRRVLKPGGVLAAWCYGLADISPTVDDIVRRLANVTLKDYWPEGREHIDQQYQHYPFALPVADRSTFYSTRELSLEGLIGYLQSWSPRANYLKQHGVDIIEQHRQQITDAWGDVDKTYQARTPIHLVLGIK